MAPIQQPLPPRRPAGFTLLELLITITIIGILASLATPSFKSLIMGQRIKTASFDLITNLTLARSEAIKQNGNVTMSPVSGTWTNGWIITGTSGTVRTQSGYTNLSITGPTTVVYNRSGRFTSGATVNFEVNDASTGTTVIPRCVTLGLTGQATSKKGSCS
jgi:type IV fimbrial biogenesis protein FimT